MTHSGQCLCGKVRFRAADLNTDYHACHCSMCRRWSGGPAFAASAENVTFDGEQHIIRFASSDWAERGFCRHCGGHLFYKLKDHAAYHLWIGALDDQAALRLVGEIFIDEKPPGYAFAGTHSRMTGAEAMAAFQRENT